MVANASWSRDCDSSVACLPVGEYYSIAKLVLGPLGTEGRDRRCAKLSFCSFESQTLRIQQTVSPFHDEKV